MPAVRQMLKLLLLEGEVVAEEVVLLEVEVAVEEAVVLGQLPASR